MIRFIIFIGDVLQRVLWSCFDYQQSVVVASAVAAGALGAIAGATVELGRRIVILYSSIIFIVGAIVMAVAPTLDELLVGRVIVGFATGISSMTGLFSSYEPFFIRSTPPPSLTLLFIWVG
jgi:MFS family permease